MRMRSPVSSAHGADLVFHSATKFLSGHGVLIGGLLVDSGRFSWDAARVRDKFPTLTEPYPGFHDMVFVEESTTAAFLLRARREGVRDFGACMGVFQADNRWWLDVLENGPASRYAGYFDIEWEPLSEELRGKVLLPILGDQYGTVLERGE